MIEMSTTEKTDRREARRLQLKWLLGRRRELFAEFVKVFGETELLRETFPCRMAVCKSSLRSRRGVERCKGGFVRDCLNVLHIFDCAGKHVRLFKKVWDAVVFVECDLTDRFQPRSHSPSRYEKPLGFSYTNHLKLQKSKRTFLTFID